MVGRAVGDDIDARLREQLAVVPINRRFPAEHLPRAFGAPPIHVADGRHVAELGRPLSDKRTAISTTDDADPQSIVFRFTFIGSGVFRAEPIGNGCSGRQGGCLSQKSTARQLRKHLNLSDLKCVKMECAGPQFRARTRQQPTTLRGSPVEMLAFILPCSVRHGHRFPFPTHPIIYTIYTLCEGYGFSASN